MIGIAIIGIAVICSLCILCINTNARKIRSKVIEWYDNDIYNSWEDAEAHGAIEKRICGLRCGIDCTDHYNCRVKYARYNRRRNNMVEACGRCPECGAVIKETDRNEEDLFDCPKCGEVDIEEDDLDELDTTDNDDDGYED